MNSPDDAQFFIQYEELSREATVTGERTKERQQRSQMLVFTVASNRKIMVWSDTSSRDTEHFMGMKMYDSGRSESKLTEKFLKALKKARDEKTK